MLCLGLFSRNKGNHWEEERRLEETCVESAVIAVWSLWTAFLSHSSSVLIALSLAHSFPERGSLPTGEKWLPQLFRSLSWVNTHFHFSAWERRARITSTNTSAKYPLPHLHHDHNKGQWRLLYPSRESRRRTCLWIGGRCSTWRRRNRSKG